MDTGDFFLLGLVFGVCVGFLIVGVAHLGDSVDSVDVHHMGEQMCSEIGLVYDHRTFENKQYDIPTIYCRNESQKELFDGILKMN